MSHGAGSGQLGGTSTLGDAFYPLYRLLFDEDGDLVDSVEDKLAQARMVDNVEMYISRALAVGTIAGLALWLLGMLLGYLLIVVVLGIQDPQFLGLRLEGTVQEIVSGLKIPFMVFVSGLVFGVIGFAIGFGSLVSIPYFRANARKREINVLLSDSVSFMYALSVGGLNQLEILQAMAQADDTYGECAKEFQSIVLETEYFDTDYRTAIRNQALETPSDELSQFLTDMLSIIDSGGDMTSFLEDQKDKHMRTAKQEQKRMLDTLELFGEMYMTLSLFPLLLIIILVIMSMMSEQSQTDKMVGTVYGLIPLTGVGFIVLTSTVTQDSIGDGYLRPDRDERTHAETDEGLLSLGLVERYTGEYGVFDRIKSREGTHRAVSVLRRPHIFFRDNPLMVLAVTVPITVVVLALIAVFHLAPMTVSEFVVPRGADVPEGELFEDPAKRWQYPVIVGTFMWVYVPLYMNLLPLAIFYEWNVRTRRSVIGNLSENLRKLASANDTGMTLLESIRVVADTSSGRLADEFEAMHAKVEYGTSLKDALREFNNEYHIPRLARTVKLISEAQEASSRIQDVLSTAAQASENQDDIDRERIARTRMQMVIIIMTYLTLLGVMALLEIRFLSVMADLADQTGGQSTSNVAAGPTGDFSGVNTDLLSLLFFHAVTLQAILSSFIAGYIREVNLLAGVKFAVALPTVALVTWYGVTLIA